MQSRRAVFESQADPNRKETHDVAKRQAYRRVLVWDEN